MPRSVLALFLVFCWLAACGSDEAPAPAPDAPPPPAEPEPAPSPEPSQLDAPPGAASYVLYCATCHGSEGKGDGPAATGLDPKPADHTNAAYMNPLSDEHLFRVIKEGGAAVDKSPQMAPWGGTLSDDEIRDLIAFIRTLANP